MSKLFYIKLDLLPTNVDSNISNYVARFSTASISRDLNSFLFNKVSISDAVIWFSTDKAGLNEIASKKVYWSSVNKLFAFDIKFPNVGSLVKNTIYMQVGTRPSGYDENPYSASKTLVMPMIEDFNDLTTNGNNGTAGGGLISGSVTGPDGYLPATAFNGSTQGIAIGSGLTFFPSNDDATWELWFYDDATQVNPEVLVETGGTTLSLILHLENGNLYGVFNESNIAYYAGSSYSTEQWNYAVVAREDSGPLHLYLNGVEVATNSSDIFNLSSYGSDTGAIGRADGIRLFDQATTIDNVNHFGGNMYNVVATDSLVTSEEVKLNYALQGPNAADNWRANLSFVGKVIV